MAVIWEPIEALTSKDSEHRLYAGIRKPDYRELGPGGGFRAPGGLATGLIVGTLTEGVRRVC